MARITPATFLSLVLLVGLPAACMDPIHSDAVAALGGEPGGVRRGPEHRPGQPCIVCHGSEGPATPAWSIAGTAYTTRGGADILPGATVVLTEPNGTEYRLNTNRGGNFYIEESQWQPTYPLRARIESGSEKVEMQSLINGPTSCATCHRGSGDPSHVPPIYLRLP